MHQGNYHKWVIRWDFAKSWHAWIHPWGLHWLVMREVVMRESHPLQVDPAWLWDFPEKRLASLGHPVPGQPPQVPRQAKEAMKQRDKTTDPVLNWEETYRTCQSCFSSQVKGHLIDSHLALGLLAHQVKSQVKEIVESSQDDWPSSWRRGGREERCQVAAFLHSFCNDICVPFFHWCYTYICILAPQVL